MITKATYIEKMLNLIQQKLNRNNYSTKNKYRRQKYK